MINRLLPKDKYSQYYFRAVHEKYGFTTVNSGRAQHTLSQFIKYGTALAQKFEYKRERASRVASQLHMQLYFGYFTLSPLPVFKGRTALHLSATRTFPTSVSAAAAMLGEKTYTLPCPRLVYSRGAHICLSQRWW